MGTALLHERLKNIQLPELMRELPVDKRGFPVPWFVEWIRGEPEFRVMSLTKKHLAVREGLCWVCGQHFTNRRRYFVIGPMCVLNRNTSEPPCHEECAIFSACGCPFLSMPKMIRRGGGIVEDAVMDEYGISRNPGAVAIYETRRFRPYYPEGERKGNFLIELGDPVTVTWWAEGRPAVLQEVLASIQSGLPILRDMCDRESTPERRLEALKALDDAFCAIKQLLPPEVSREVQRV